MNVLLSTSILFTGGFTMSVQAQKINRHNPTIAMVLSILFAGLGQFYNRRYLKGLILIIIEVAFLITF